MNVTVEPPISRWRLARPGGADRRGLFAAANANAATLGTGRLAEAEALVATGHQAWLWHPGILAKYLALARAAPPLNAAPFHLVVDQDIHDALGLELPVRHGNRLTVEALHLAHHDTNVPTGCQAPVDAGAVVATLRQASERWGAELLADPHRIAEAFADLPKCATLAQQLAVVLARLMRPHAGELPVVFVTDLCRLEVFHGLTDRMLRDARGCVNAYNRAATRFSEARIAPLTTEPDRVELPLWLLEWARPRQRVFADLADTGRAILTLESGRAIDPSKELLAPRAVSLSVLLRSWACDLFIHGKGGGVYDQVTEAWWREWAGAELAPMAVVSADVALELDVPVAAPEDLERAVWRVHHLPANIDRVAGGDAAAPGMARKRELLAHMADDRDTARRAAAFAEIHRINEGLVRDHPALLVEAGQQLERARDGVANRAVAAKRDWCFALYPEEDLRRLGEAIRI